MRFSASSTRSQSHWFGLVFCQCKAFPLCQRMNHFGNRIAHVFYRKTNRTLSAAEVVVDAKSAKHKKRGCNASQPEFRRETAQEEVFYLLDCLLRLVQVQQCSITVWFQEFAHIVFYILPAKLVCLFLFANKKSKKSYIISPRSRIGLTICHILSRRPRACKWCFRSRCSDKSVLLSLPYFRRLWSW